MLIALLLFVDDLIIFAPLPEGDHGDRLIADLEGGLKPQEILEKCASLETLKRMCQP